MIRYEHGTLHVHETALITSGMRPVGVLAVRNRCCPGASVVIVRGPDGFRAQCCCGVKRTGWQIRLIDALEAWADRR